MITNLGNPARHVCLARLILPWREPKMRSDHSRGPEAIRIVDSRGERQRHESADTGGRHETPDPFVGTSNGQQPL